MNAMVSKESVEEKCGLKLSLDYLLKKAARFTKTDYIIDGKNDEAVKRDNFLSLLYCSWGHQFYSPEVVNQERS